MSELNDQVAYELGRWQAAAPAEEQARIHQLAEQLLHALPVGSKCQFDLLCHKPGSLFCFADAAFAPRADRMLPFLCQSAGCFEQEGKHPSVCLFSPLWGRV